MRNQWKWILSLAVPVMLTVNVYAADRPVPEGETVELLLLRQVSVQKELKISKTDADTIHSFTDEQQKKARAAHKLSDAESKAKYEELGKENEAFLKKHLKAEQHERLQQIAMQKAGLLWLTNPHVAKKLNLTEQQMQQAKTDQKKAREQTDEALASTNASDRDSKLKKVNQTCRDQLMAILTPAQKEKWKEMVGTPFEGDLLFSTAPNKSNAPPPSLSRGLGGLCTTSLILPEDDVALPRGCRHPSERLPSATCSHKLQARKGNDS